MKRLTDERLAEIRSADGHIRLPADDVLALHDEVCWNRHRIEELQRENERWMTRYAVEMSAVSAERDAVSQELTDVYDAIRYCCGKTCESDVDRRVAKVAAERAKEQP